MAHLDQYRANEHESPFIWLEDCDLKVAVRSIVEAWAARFELTTGRTESNFSPNDFGVLEPYLAEAILIEHGADFVFSKWGAALDIVCGGARLADRLSALPQPSRSHLRRVCVRAAATRMPAISRATWALDGEIWRCAIMALPTRGDDFSVKRLLVALLYAPYPFVADGNIPEGFGWPPSVPRGSVHVLANGLPVLPRRTSPLRGIALALRRLLSANAMR
ncbi:MULTISPECIES: hypothetical protein [unclassified Mesorhizobium]|uniref:hypothetical protein n=1 Tax=unclassified Mesorhizobium TaxID=325217 RepID=UPI001CCDF99C|nr:MULTISPECIES: hypothetical protein [unclassified Mesorhizobium]MBZ9742216.1 hypothetical protein [Mesorhizobium sp. CO1-1-4]MBZ9805821.1 hypothetical protein [Mesorhizobium sp. ES1-6]